MAYPRTPEPAACSCEPKGGDASGATLPELYYGEGPEAGYGLLPFVVSGLIGGAIWSLFG